MSLFSAAKSFFTAPFRALKAHQEEKAKEDFDKKLRARHPKVLLRLDMKSEIKRRGLRGHERRAFRKVFQSRFRVAPDAVTGRLMLTAK